MKWSDDFQEVNGEGFALSTTYPTPRGKNLDETPRDKM